MLRDFRHALRTLLRTPGFTLVAVLTLALGIGANTAVFSIVNGVLLQSLPYHEPERLYTVWETGARDQPRPASYPTFQDWREQSDAFEDLVYIRGEDVAIRSREGTQRLTGAFVSPGFFRTLGVQPVLGRGFAGGEPGAGAHPVVLSHRFWRDRFGGEPDVVGRTLQGVQGSYTVVGVMPPTAYPDWADLWLPMAARPASDPFFTQRDLHVDSDVVARLKEGVTLPRAQAQLNAVAARIAAAYPDDSAEYTRVEVTPLRDRLLGDVEGRLLVLSAAVALVLLVACVNVANLMLARATARARELAVRAALGAGRGRLVRQLLTEALLLALAGGASGVLLAAWAVEAFTARASDALPRLDEVALDGRVLLFSLAVSVGAALLFGLLPAFRATTSSLAPALRSGTAGTGTGRQGVRLRSALVVGQVALTLVLLVGAGLLIRSLWELHRESLGFDPDPVVAVRIFPPSPRYDDPAAAAELYRRLEEAAAGVPGVVAPAVANHIPLAGPNMVTRVRVAGHEPPPEGDGALFRSVSPGYFAALRIPLRRGRPFGNADLSAPGGVIVNETFARTFLGDRDPVGQTVTVTKSAQGRPDFGKPITAQVVGVVADVREFGLDVPPPPVVFVPYTANPWGNTFLIARAAGDPRSLVPALRRAALAVDPDLPIAGPGFLTDFHLVRDYLGVRLAERNLQTRVLAGFAAIALVLALIGLFGVLSYLVAMRTREIGVRIALGAPGAKVLGLVVGQAMRILAVGIGIGLLGALAATRLLRSSLYGVGAADPLTFAAAALVFAAVALLASYVPARRATRVDPMVALRAE
jgi:putative ABC transport system permease protein